MNKSHFLTALKAASAFMAKNDVRYYLNGILFDFQPGELRLVATDGHVLFTARLEFENDYTGNHIISGADITKMQKLYTHKDPTIALQFAFLDDCSAIEISDGPLSFKICLVDGVFPDWKRVIPKREKTDDAGQTIGINTAYLAKVAKALEPLTGKFNGVRMDVFGPDKSIKFEPNLPSDLAITITECYAVIMPMRL